MSGIIRLPNKSFRPTLPKDWININNVNDNEINILVSDKTLTYSFGVTTSTGTYSIDWGDGTITTGNISGGVSHTYTQGTGTPCSLGYTTFKIRIYDAEGDITSWKVYPVQHQYVQSYLNIVYGTTKLTDTYSTFYSLNNFICPDLQSATLPITLNEITTLNRMFENCYSLLIVKFPEVMNGISQFTTSYMFAGCSSLKYIIMPLYMNSVTDMSYMFKDCYTLDQIIMSKTMNNATNMSYMFQNCYSLKSLYLPTTLDYLTNISNMCNGCYSLDEVILADSMNSLTSMNYMFAGCYSLDKITLPTSANSLTSMSSMFNACYSLKSIVLPEISNLSDINSMFYNCYSLSSVTFPSTLTTLTNTNYTFYGCKTLESITLPENLDSLNIASNMFEGCISLKTITNLDKIGRIIACSCNNILAGCTMLRSTIYINLVNNYSFNGTSSLYNVCTDLVMQPQINYSNIIRLDYVLGLTDSIINDIISKVYNNGCSYSQNLYLTGSHNITKTIVSASSTALSKTLTITNTQGLYVGMEVYGGGLTNESGLISSLTAIRTCTITTNTSNVTHNNHGLSEGQLITFTSIGSITGLNERKQYYVRNPLTNTFNISLTINGSLITFGGTTTASGKYVVIPRIVSINPNTSITLDTPALTTTSGYIRATSTTPLSRAMLGGFTVYL